MLIDGVLIVELGYEFNSKYWNQGYATEAAVAVRDFAFRQLHLRTITSLVRAGNLAAMRVSEKIGMKRTAEIIYKGKQYWQYEISEKSDQPDWRFRKQALITILEIAGYRRSIGALSYHG